MSLFCNPQSDEVWGHMSDIMKDFLKIRDLKLLKWCWKQYLYNNLLLFMTWLSLAAVKTKNAQWLIDGLNFNCYKSWDSNQSENGQFQFMHMYAAIHSINSDCQVPCVYCQEYRAY